MNQTLCCSIIVHTDSFSVMLDWKPFQNSKFIKIHLLPTSSFPPSPCCLVKICLLEESENYDAESIQNFIHSLFFYLKIGFFLEKKQICLFFLKKKKLSFFLKKQICHFFLKKQMCHFFIKKKQNCHCFFKKTNLSFFH